MANTARSRVDETAAAERGPVASVLATDPLAERLATSLCHAHPTLFQSAHNVAVDREREYLTLLLHTRSLSAMGKLHQALDIARARDQIVIAVELPAPLGVVGSQVRARASDTLLDGVDMRLRFPPLPEVTRERAHGIAGAAIEDLAYAVLTQTVVCLDLADVLALLTEGNEAYAATGHGATSVAAVEDAWRRLPVHVLDSCRGALFVLSSQEPSIAEFEEAAAFLGERMRGRGFGGTLYVPSEPRQQSRATLFVS